MKPCQSKSCSKYNSWIKGIAFVFFPGKLWVLDGKKINREGRKGRREENWVA